MSKVAMEMRLKNWNYESNDDGTYQAFTFVLEPRGGYNYEVAEFWQNIMTMAHRDGCGCPLVWVTIKY